MLKSNKKEKIMDIKFGDNQAKQLGENECITQPSKSITTFSFIMSSFITVPFACSFLTLL